jgi:small subunit ribosomal protein S6
LPKDDIQGIADKYVNYLTSNDCEIVHVDRMGLRQLAYAINRRNSGVYYCVEFQSPDGKVIDTMELNMRRDEQLLRFLTVSLDKYGVKYNADKRAGLIGKKKKSSSDSKQAEAPKAEAPKTEAPKAKAPKAEAPVVEAPVVEAPVVEAPVVEKEAPAAKDDLKKIEGVGPKIESLLHDAGILTYAQLAASEVDKIKEILAAAGSRFTMHDPTTWTQQAQMAADGNWDSLKSLQDELQGGKAVDASSEEE